MPQSVNVRLCETGHAETMRSILSLFLAIVFGLGTPCVVPVQLPPRALVLVYHGIGPRRPYWIPPERFEADIVYLQSHGYHPVGLAEFRRSALHGAPLPDRPVLITFDDGVTSVRRFALPITVRHRVPAVLFMIGRRIGRPGHLSAMDLGALERSGLWSVAAHTHDMHRYVQGVRGFRAELATPRPGEPPESRAARIRRDAQLEFERFRAAGLPEPTAFAFPYGQHDAASVAVLRSIYPLLFDSRPAIATPGDSPIPRLDATSAPLPILLRRYAF